jgi:hypothetical protein
MPNLNDLANDYIKNAKALNHIRVVHIFDKDWSYGGCTVAYKPKLHDADGYPTGEYADVAVAYCHPNDRYNRKYGEARAVLNLIKNKSVSMPIYRMGFDDLNPHPVRKILSIFQDTFNI